VDFDNKVPRLAKRSHETVTLILPHFVGQLANQLTRRCEQRHHWPAVVVLPAGYAHAGHDAHHCGSRDIA
jgi:hypothetical protein